MAFSITHTDAGTGPANSPARGLSQLLLRAGSRLAAGLGATIKAAQVGQMKSALASMSDRQLAEIGITRAEIPQYAQRLMTQE